MTELSQNSVLNETQLKIFNILKESIENKTLFTTLRYFVNLVVKLEKCIPKDVVIENIEVVLDEFVKLNLLIKHTAVFIDPDNDIILSQEAIEYYNETGELYNPYTGLKIPYLYGDDSYDLFYIYETCEK